MTPETLEYCKKCKQGPFTWRKLHLHRLANQDTHLTCWRCEHSFHTPEALKRHNDITHSNEQSLRCPGCQELFTRVGGLVAHLEQDVSCHAGVDIYAKNREEIRKGEGKFEAIRQGHAVGQSRADDKESISSSFTRISMSNEVPKSEGADDWGLWGGVPAEKTKPTFELSGNDFPTLTPIPTVKRKPWLMGNDDLLIGDFEDRTPQAREMSNTMNWREVSQALPSASNYTVVSTFSDLHSPPLARVSGSQLSTSSTRPLRHPAVNKQDIPRTCGAIGNSPSVASTPLLKETSPLGGNTKPDPKNTAAELTGAQYAKHDPSNPEFRPHRYYIEFTKKYKCPHQGCPKSFPSVGQFISHLRSPAHAQDLKHGQCELCLRYFDDASALVQHVESQGVRCKVRTADNFGTYIDKITGETVALDGVLDDLTNKYEVTATKDAMSSIRQAISDHKEDAETKRIDYWKKNKDQIKW